MKVDYIIVGLGLAGTAFSRELEKNNHSFLVFENDSQNASRVAGGIYNPLVLKRFNPVWDAEKQLKTAAPYYRELEELLQNKYDYKIDIYRLFSSVKEQDEWLHKASNATAFSDYMTPKIVTKNFDGITAPFGYGRVTKTGRIDTKKLVEDYRSYLDTKKQIRVEDFDYSKIEFLENSIRYQNIEARKIIFCEGFGMRKNPFFKTLPMEEAKGELITIHAPDLKIDIAIKATVFIIPLGNQLFKIGSTFNWDDKTSTPTEAAKNELIKKLKSIITVPFTVVKHVAGIRPTVHDRRPLVGLHAKHPQLAILNGLGTRGVMVVPTIAKELFNHIENGGKLRKEININRFD